MKVLSNLARPDMAFIVPWSIVLACYLPLSTPLTPPFDSAVAAVLFYNLVTAPLIYCVVDWAVSRRLGAPGATSPTLDADTIQLLGKFLVAIMVVWGGVFAASIAYSGGLPLIWALTDSSKTYADFGIPTIGGLSILLRGFCASLCILLFMLTRRMLYLSLWTLLLFLCLTEISRSAFLMLACQSLCTFLLLSRPRFRHVAIVVMVLVFVAGSFMLMGAARGIQMSASDFQITSFGNLPAGVYWAWAYIVSPLGNVNYAASAGIVPTYLPLNTLAGVIPSVFGLRPTEYPIKLIDQSLNATSIYAPLMADFGYAGAALFMTLFQAIASYAYAMARRGRLLYILFYPALFGALVLSIFYIYLMSLQILLVPAMVIWMRKYLARKRSESGLDGQLREEGT